MKEKLYEICGEIVENEEESKKLSSYETLDELYDYFLKKVPDLTKEEFDEFVCECLKNYEKGQEDITKLQGANLGAVSGGAMGWKERLTAGMLAVMSFIPAAGATNKAPASAGAPQSVSTQKSIKTKISDAFGKTKAWIKAHPKLTIGIGLAAATVIGGGIYLATRNTKDKGKQVDDEAKIGASRVSKANASKTNVSEAEASKTNVSKTEASKTNVSETEASLANASKKNLASAATQNQGEIVPAVPGASVQPKSEGTTEKDKQKDVQKPKEEIARLGAEEQAKLAEKIKELEARLKKYVDENFATYFGFGWNKEGIIGLCIKALDEGKSGSFTTDKYYETELLKLKFKAGDSGYLSDERAEALQKFLEGMQNEWNGIRLRRQLGIRLKDYVDENFGRGWNKEGIIELCIKALTEGKSGSFTIDDDYEEELENLGFNTVFTAGVDDKKADELEDFLKSMQKDWDSVKGI